MSEMVAETWSSFVRQWLRDNDRSQAWLCRQAGLSETHFSKQINGHRHIDRYDLNALERAMSIPSDYLSELEAEGPESGAGGGE